MLTVSPAQCDFRARFHPAATAEGTFFAPSDVILFMHIPKTAGMSVGKALQRAFDLFHPVAWENTAQSFRQQSKKALYARTGAPPVRQVLMGHFGWPEVMFWKTHELPIKCATIIRDPLSRFHSNYRYNCSDQHPQNAQFKTRFPTLESYAHQLPHDYQLSLMLGAFYSFDHALEKLATYYSFIGVTEYLGASLDHFHRTHGLPKLREHHENTARKNGDLVQDEISDTVRNIVMEKSRNDLRLHTVLSDYYSAAP